MLNRSKVFILFPLSQAAESAYYESQLVPEDIDWFGLYVALVTSVLLARTFDNGWFEVPLCAIWSPRYDCYPACFIRAVEACGLAPAGKGGEWCEEMYQKTENLDYDPTVFPVNTHGGLLAFGAPWEVWSTFLWQLRAQYGV